LEWVKRHGFKGGEETDMSKLKERQLKIKCDQLQLELDVQKGRYILISEAQDEVTRMVTEAKSVLRSKFESELPPVLVGMTAAQIQYHSKQAIDEVCEKLSK
jgi:hypothetical protein